jgi:hypothetical protein
MIATAGDLTLAAEAEDRATAERLVKAARGAEEAGRFGVASEDGITVRSCRNSYYVTCDGDPQTRHAEGWDGAVRLVARMLGGGE